MIDIILSFEEYPHIVLALCHDLNQLSISSGVDEYFEISFTSSLISICFSKVLAPFAYDINIESTESPCSCVESPITWFGYLFLRNSIWFNCSSWSLLGYVAIQWFIAIGIFLLSKKATKSSISFKDIPPKDTITGFWNDAILFNKIQSLLSALATFIIGRFKLSQKSTDDSSNGVAIGIKPHFLMWLTNIL